MTTKEARELILETAQWVLDTFPKHPVSRRENLRKAILTVRRALEAEVAKEKT